MTITNPYPRESFNRKTFFRFDSMGEQGIINKWIWFQDIGNSRYNLAFGDLINEEFSDSIISNNHDFVRVMSTIADAVYEFFEYYPNAVIEIKAVDEKRLVF